MHIKKTNNTNKLIQISYRSILTKIQKLQNFKKKKKIYVPAGTPGASRYCPKFSGTAGTRPVRPVFFPVRNKGVKCTGLLIGTIYSDRYGTELTTLLWTNKVPVFLFRVKKNVSYSKISIHLKVNHNANCLYHHKTCP